MSDFLEIFHVALWSTIKFFYAPLIAIARGLGFWESLFAVLSGGLASFLGFYYATDIFLAYTKHFKPVIIFVTPTSTRLYYRKWQETRRNKRKPRKRFSKRNKLFVKIRTKWGMWGIIFATPIALSIPLGAFLLRKYYGHNKTALPAGIFVLITEGFIFNLVYWLLFKVFNV